MGLVELLLVVLLVLLILLLAFCFWHIFTPVPFVPSTKKVIATMVQLANITPLDTIYDLGCGDARLLISAKEFQPNCTAFGYEFLPSAYLQGMLRIWWNNQNIHVYRRSFFKADLRTATVIFLYLFPNVMQQLEQKLIQELQPGTRVISHAFQFTHRLPNKTVTVQDGYRERKIYVYIW